MPFSADAAELFWEFADEVEKEMGPGGEYESIRPLAAKLPEHAARLGATIAAYRDLIFTELVCEDFLRGMQIAVYYANEAKRIFDSAGVFTDLLLAQKLLDWLKKDWCYKTITARDIYPTRSECHSRSQ